MQTQPSNTTTTRRIKAKPGYRHGYNVRINHVAGEAKRNGGAIRTMDEVAQILGISRQAVHQVERTALYKLRCAFLSEIRDANPSLHEACVAQQQQQLSH